MRTFFSARYHVFNYNKFRHVDFFLVSAKIKFSLGIAYLFFESDFLQRDFYVSTSFSSISLLYYETVHIARRRGFNVVL